jgi:hypothetical protein
VETRPERKSAKAGSSQKTSGGGTERRWEQQSLQSTTAYGLIHKRKLIFSWQSKKEVTVLPHLIIKI